ncbi:MAG: glycoside hydrolase family 2 [Herbinix sp.]|nr:glycoside hydrolase family 2 [Herbinix sp.]
MNDGWEHTISDIITLHDYAEKGEEKRSRYESSDNVLNNIIPFNIIRYAMANGYEYKGQPVILSEYGGIAFTSKEGWGYGKQVKSESDFLERYTQITQEVNGLLRTQSGYRSSKKN